MSIRPEDRVRTEGGVIGTRAVHAEFVDKVKGTLAYADDWYMAGLLHGKVVRSYSASARIISIDTAEAEALSGVHAVLTARDVPHNSMTEEAIGFGVSFIQTPVLAAERVRYEGEPVALIAAEHPEIAEEAAERIIIEYEDLAGVFDPMEALGGDAARVHEQGNVLVDWKTRIGDVEAALDGADVVVEGTYRSHAVDHAYLEPEAGVGWIDTDGVVTLRISTQVIEHSREVAHILGLPQHRVRHIGTYMGGGFGGKEDMTVEPFLALLVWKTGRPVKLVWSRQESILARPKRHPMVMRYRTGASSDGTIVGQDVDVVADCGAYPYLSPRVAFAAAVVASGPYRMPNARVEVKGVFTNNVPTSAFRGFGAMQVVLGYESQMDRLAESLGMSPRDIRERNQLRKGDRLPTAETLDTEVALSETIAAAIERLESEPSRPVKPGRLRGRGFACNMQPYGRAVFFQDTASCWMSLEQDGSLTVRAGVTDLGAGQAASLAQIASEVLGVPLDRVAVHIGDSALTPLTGGTFATRQLYMSGNAALKTALELREKITPVAADLLGVTPDSVTFNQGNVGGDNDRSLTLEDLVMACESRLLPVSHLGTFFAEGGEFDPQKGQGRTFPDYTFGTHAAEVEVDEETGEVEILRYVACHDVGRAINPLRVEGQIQGGAVQGIGYAMSEELSVDSGMNQSTLFSDYLIPASTDIPDIDAVYLEIGPGKGPFGARGIGEPPIGPPAAALAAAIEDATGVRLTELPFTPERVLTELERARTGERRTSDRSEASWPSEPEGEAMGGTGPRGPIRSEGDL
jgi:CO/xanthine dehydrogenase Mo-binding subunit